MKYFIGDYEDNGYHDSYFHVVFWDTEKGAVENVQYAATAYGGGWDWHKEIERDIPADIIQQIRDWRFEQILPAFIEAEKQRCFEPSASQMTAPTRVRLLKDGKRGKTPYNKDEVGVVTGQYWFGQFFSNGYKTKDRHNGRVGIQIGNRRVFCAMTVVRLDEEPDYAAATECAKRAAEFVRCPHAWWTQCNNQIAR